jgi:hypothetical protein
MINFSEKNETTNEEIETENLDLHATTSANTYPLTHTHTHTHTHTPHARARIHTCYLPVTPVKD